METVNGGSVTSFCAAGLVQPPEDRAGNGQDDDAQPRVCLPAAGHGESLCSYVVV